MAEIYLDNSLAARPSDRALSEMFSLMQKKWGSPIAPHSFGQSLYPLIEKGYRSLYQLIGASEEDTIIFTASGAEAVNLAIFSTFERVCLTSGRNQILFGSNSEAPAMMACESLRERECVVQQVNANEDGIITVDAVADLLTPRTALLSLSWADGLTGLIQPVVEIGELCKERGVIFHLDATHVLGKLHFSLEDIGADLISWGGEPLHAPPGCGALWIKGDPAPIPLIHGGAQQGGWRAGSLNVPALAAFGIACEEALEARDLLATHISQLKYIFEKRLLEEVEGAEVFFHTSHRLPHCTTLSFKGVLNEALLFYLDQCGIYASIGGGGFQQLSYVLKGGDTAISFSFSRETTEDEVHSAVDMIAKCVDKLQRMRG